MRVMRARVRAMRVMQKGKIKNKTKIKKKFQNVWVRSGAIIGDGDHKRALFLGLAPWYGTIFLFFEQIAPSPSIHARTCCEDFCGWRAGEMASKIPEIFYAFGPQLNAFTSVGILLKYFRQKLFQFEWSKTVPNLRTSRFMYQSIPKPPIPPGNPRAFDSR